MKFTIVIPTHANGAVIGAAIESAQEQSLAAFELFVVCDGAPAETINLVKAYAAKDSRVRLFVFDKGERHGEAWRDRALQQATGDAVCYLSDDDFWFPDHLETMAGVLESADFGHTRQAEIKSSFEIGGVPQQITDPRVQHAMRTSAFNIFGLSCAGHRLEAYRRLPVGWSPAPQGLATDLHMWRKFLNAPGTRFAASGRVTGIHSPTSPRERTPWATLCEVSFWQALFQDQHIHTALHNALPPNGALLPLAFILERARALRAAASSPSGDAAQ